MVIYSLVFFRIMCGRYRMVSSERFSISLWILLLGILRSRRILMVSVWMEPRIQAVVIFKGRTCHPCWVNSGRSRLYFSSFHVVVP